MQTETNDFSRGSVARNILNLALPMTAAQLINVLYSIVDRIYIGRLPHTSAEALTGIGLTLPVITIITAFANLFGMGGAPLCSIARGEHNEEKAEKVMGNSFVLLLISGGILMLFCLIFKRPLLYLFGASDASWPYADQYITIYLLGTLFVMISLGMNNFINAQGFGKMGMLTVLLGAVLNIVLDPILIFGFNMGVRGAAVATIISQGASAFWVLKFLTGKRALLHLNCSGMRLELETGKGDYASWNFRIRYVCHKRPGSDCVQCNAFPVRRRFIRGNYDGDQFRPGDYNHAGDRTYFRRPAGNQL